MEWIIEDVVAVANGDWEAVAAILVLNPYRSVENFCNVFYLKLVNATLIHFCI